MNCPQKAKKSAISASRRVLELSAAALFGAVLVSTVASALPKNASPYRNLGVFARALAHVELSYVEEADQDQLIHGAIRGMISELDPHSAFMDPQAYRILTNDTEGRFGGIGVEIDAKDGWLTVVSAFEGGPAHRAGIKSGDRFVFINGQSARDVPIDEAVRLMRGEPGTQVRFRIRKAASERVVDMTLKREIIRVNAVEARVLSDRMVYVRLKAFQETTTDELRQALDTATAQTARSGGVRGLLLDLRDNSGGLLDEAILVADEFLSSGTIVSTRGRGGRLLSEARASATGTRPPWPIVVLVNGYSASAAEIVAGALRDNRRATVVGTRTFGKGSVQNIIELPDGSAIKLTIARYFTPSGRSIQAEGIEPDMFVEQLDSKTLKAAQLSSRVSEASLEGHLTGSLEDRRRRYRNPDRDQARIAAAPEAGLANAFEDDFQARNGLPNLESHCPWCFKQGFSRILGDYTLNLERGCVSSLRLFLSRDCALKVSDTNYASSYQFQYVCTQ